MSPRNSQADMRRPIVPRHSGHDARPTSRKELLGWYAYAFAAETYVICGIGRLSIVKQYLWATYPEIAKTHY